VSDDHALDTFVWREGDTVAHRTFCRWCPSLCGVIVGVRENRVAWVRGDPDHPLSRGYTCPKGRGLGEWHHHPARLDQPVLAGTTVNAADMLDELAAQLRAIVDQSGPDSVGIYHGTAAFFDASRGVADAFMAAIGSQSRYTSLTIDCPSKPLVSELVAGHRLMPMIDVGRTSLVLLIGTNPVVSHGQNLGWPDPVVRLRALARAGELWVVDPRRTETARLATRHLAPRPGTDDAMLAWLVRELLRDGADHEYLAHNAQQVEELAHAVEPFDLGRVSGTCDIPEADLLELLAAIRRAGRIAATTGTGTSMGPTANTTEWLTWALLVVTGSYDRPGGMWFNPGYFAQLDRKELAASDGRSGPGPASRQDLPRRNDQWPCAALVDEIEAGHLRALFNVGGNPISAFPQPARLRRALGKLDALIVLDVVENEMSQVATHVLPTTGQLERADLPLWLNLMQPAVFGQYTPAVFSSTEGRQPLWWWFGQIGRRLGLDVLPGGRDPDHISDDDVLAPIADASRSDFTTLRSRALGHVADTCAFGWVHDILPDGGWRLAPPELVAQLVADRPSTGLVMIPRRQIRHLNSGLRDIGAAGITDQPDVLVNPGDARVFGIKNGAAIRVTSPAGSVVGVARIAEGIRAGSVSVPHGFDAPYVGELVSDTERVDPLTGMVLQSGLPVRIETVTSTEL